MKTRCSVLLVALVIASLASAEEPCTPRKNSLPAPENLTAWGVPDDLATPQTDESAVAARWDPVEKATKYTVEAVASYELCGRSETFQFTVLAPSTSISIPIAELATCADGACGSMLDAQSVVFRVKALNPPRGKVKDAQCNPFSSACAVEVCGDGVDGDCDGATDEDCDADGDGYAADGSAGCLGTATGDCDDHDPAVHPGAADSSCGGGDDVDNDCDGEVDEDPCPAVIDIETLTNGQDADSEPGPHLPLGSAVQWLYVVTNQGDVALSSVLVTDDKGVTVTCPKTALAPGESMTCTARGIAQAGQYANLGTATGTTPSGPTVTDTDWSHYYGDIHPAIAIETGTNGQDADTPPGPSIATGGAVQWMYVVINAGDVPLTRVQVTDDKGVTVTCPKAALQPGESMTCTGSGVAQAGPYSNVGTATGTAPTGAVVTDTDASHYLGVGPAIRIKKFTNGEDADSTPGPYLPVLSTVHWSYVVTNIGIVTLSSVQVTDDDTGAAVSCPKVALEPGESMTCTSSGLATPGQYSNVGTATGTPPGGPDVTATDASHYYGFYFAGISLEKSTNGDPADEPPGPSIVVGQAVQWTYWVANSGDVRLSNVTVTDDMGVMVTCPKTALDPGESMTCTGSGTALELGQYSNVGTATGTPPVGSAVTAYDASHYLGVSP